MLKTLIGKFTFFFWAIFFTIGVAIYFFSTLFIKDMLQTIEKEKVQLIVNTLKPTIAYNLAFGVDDGINKLLKTILNEKNIVSVHLYSTKIDTSVSKTQNPSLKILSYSSTIQDPFTNLVIANIEVTYSNKNLLILYHKIISILLFIFFLALIVFLSFYLYIKKELNALKSIANTMNNYASKQDLSPIVIKKSTCEINTIATAANAMIENISKHVSELKSFNTKLEKQVQEKVAELQTQEQMLVHQSRQAAMGEMIESIAHQWRQPLNIIGLSSANLEMEYDLGVMTPENFKDKMEIISLNINYMSNTIDDFRDFLNPDTSLTHFNPQEIIEEVFKILKAQLSNNKISFTIEIENEISLLGNANEFKQVIFILINNSKDAIKSLQQKEKIKEGAIKVHIRKEADKNILSFCDNGGGIKEDIIHSIFNPYFSTKFASSGTGIGLYIAKNIIESRMGANLEAKNIENGCCFTIEQSINIEEKI